MYGRHVYITLWFMKYNFSISNSTHINDIFKKLCLCLKEKIIL